MGTAQKKVPFANASNRLYFALFLILSFSLSCGVRYFAGPMQPMAQDEQKTRMEVSDDGTVAYIYERLEVSLRPVTDEELNRQFSQNSKEGIWSTNPYTYGNWKDPITGETPSRFTIFRLKVKNYAFPKIQVDPLMMVMVSQNGRRYTPLSLLQLEEYYSPYARGYAGVAYERFDERKDLLKKTLYTGEPIFSGQEREGYVVFPLLHYDVRQIDVHVRDMVLRFDIFGEPAETIDLVFRFERETYTARHPRQE